MFLPNRPAEFNVSSKQTEANSSAARNLTNFAPLNRRDDLCLASFFSGNIYIHNQQIFKVTFMNMSTGAVYIVLRIILPTRQCNNLIFTGHGSSRNNIPFLCRVLHQPRAQKIFIKGLFECTCQEFNSIQLAKVFLKTAFKI